MNKLFEPLNISDGKFEEILLNSDFNNEGWFFKDADEEFVSKLYYIYREVILDGLLPLAAVSGICLDAFQNSSVFDVTNYVGIKEALIEVMNNFSLLLFPPQKDDLKVSCYVDHAGTITSRNLTFLDGSEHYNPITHSYLFDASKPLKLSLRLSTGTGLNRIHTYASI